MQRRNYACSTPELGQERTISDITLSEIRDRDGRNKSTPESIDSIIDNHKSLSSRVLKRKGKQISAKSIKKRPIPPKFHTDSNSDSEFETVNEIEISDNSKCDEDIVNNSSDDGFMINRLFYNKNNSTLCDDNPLLALYSSPNPDKYEEYEKSIDISQSVEEEMPKSSSDMFSSPETQESSKDSSMYKCYGVPSWIIEKKNKKKLTASDISFGPKWSNPVASKYNSPGDIPWMKNSRKSKYSHLGVPRNDKFKRFVSPTKESSGSSSSKYSGSVFDEGPNVHRLPMKKDVGKKFSLKPLRELYNSTNSYNTSSDSSNTSKSNDRTIGKNLSQIFEESLKNKTMIDNNNIVDKSVFDLIKSNKNTEPWV